MLQQIFHIPNIWSATGLSPHRCTKNEAEAATLQRDAGKLQQNCSTEDDLHVARDYLGGRTLLQISLTVEAFRILARSTFQPESVNR